jgi:hypothetical protein
MPAVRRHNHRISFLFVAAPEPNYFPNVDQQTVSIWAFYAATGKTKANSSSLV